MAVPATSAGVVHGAVRLTLDKQETNALVRGYWTALVGVAVVVLVAMAGIGWAIARSVTRPLRTLDAAAARFATGDLAPVEPDPSAPPEIAVLGDTMNTMARRLDQLLAEQREFVADASHQLRTPLTALRLRLENLQSAAATAEDEDALGAAIEETNRLAALVADLLQLARAEEPAEPLTVDLAALAADRVDTWSAVADATEVAAGPGRARRPRPRVVGPGRRRADPGQPHRQRGRGGAAGIARHGDDRPAGPRRTSCSSRTTGPA